jgi:hypothetical protein
LTMKSRAIFFLKLWTEQRYNVSVALVNLNGSEFKLNSNNADNSNSNNRLRLALTLRAFCFFEPIADFFADGNDQFQLSIIPVGRNKLFVNGEAQGFFEQIKISTGQWKIGGIIN